MKLAMRNHHISGFSGDDLAFLSMRFPKSKGFTPGQSDSWVWHANAKRRRYLIGGSGWATGLWYSGAQIFVTRSRHGIYRFGAIGDTNDDDDFHQDDLRAALMGVWGLDEKNVFAWADRDLKSGIMFRWNGKKWAEMPSPGWGVMEVHGVAKDIIYAVGRRGLIARWNGKAWKKIKALTDGNLEHLQVIDEDEIHAVADDGALLRGTAKKWEVVLVDDGPLYGVARFKDQLWVAAGTRGVGRVKGGAIEIVKPKIHATSFDARRGLVAACYDQIAWTDDGVAWYGNHETSDLLAETASTDPLWD